jgi:hypothetical protein
MARRRRLARGTALLDSGDPIGTSRRIALDLGHQRILDLIADGPVLDPSASAELRERVAQWIETTATGEPN